MDSTAAFEILKIADRRASQNQDTKDVLVLAEALAQWVETRRFPEEAEPRQPLQVGL